MQEVVELAKMELLGKVDVEQRLGSHLTTGNTLVIATREACL